MSEALLEQQLAGAVAAHNLLRETQLAYVADDVGTGKTLVACGALALLRHENPTTRVMVIAPRANLQIKWRRELNSFSRHNIRYPDLRNQSADGAPVRPVRIVERLSSTVSIWGVEPDSDLVCRLSSFQLGHKQQTRADRDTYVQSWYEALVASRSKTAHEALKNALRSNSALQAKEAIAACINRLLPQIDVLVIDEAHNLKGGVVNGPDRNRVLWTLLGHNPEYLGRLSGYGSRADRVLMLSATPMEDDVRQLRSQLEVIGRAGDFPGLSAETEQERADATRSFLFRRVSRLRVGGEALTRNRYRREWREGGVESPDKQLKLEEDRDRLTFALVQKRISDALGGRSGGRQFQIGMLTSFESLAESASHGVASRKTDFSETDGANVADTFDDPDQNRLASDEEREGIDRAGVSALVRSHRDSLGTQPRHPKMDAVVKRLASRAAQGKKSLVFTRRVASVDEMIQGVNLALDDGLKTRLAIELPDSREGVSDLFRMYQAHARAPQGAQGDVEIAARAPDLPLSDEDQVSWESDFVQAEAEALRGGASFFGWLFRENRQEALITGVWLRQRFSDANGAYATLLHDNYLSAVLNCAPQDIPDHLQRAVPDGLEARQRLEELARDHLGSAAQVSRRAVFTAGQLAGLQLLSEYGLARTREQASTAFGVLHSLSPGRRELRDETAVWRRLTDRTLASDLRARSSLCRAIWHEDLPFTWDSEDAFLRREWRWRLLSSAVRLDYPAIDLWLCEVRRRGSFDAAVGTPNEEELSSDFLDLLERQQAEEGDHSAFRALESLSAEAELILEVNGGLPRDLATPSWFGNRSPAVGMSGRVNLTAVSQFRTPTYPHVMVTTDLLQEGEDLHTYCDEVHHYGIAWMPSSLEQRVGRIDRVNSLVERRLADDAENLKGGVALQESLRLQVLYPFISGTYEELQVKRVLARLDKHVRLLHSSLGKEAEGASRLDVVDEMLADDLEEVSVESLGEPFGIQEPWLRARKRQYPLVPEATSARINEGFRGLADAKSLGGIPVVWLVKSADHLLGECSIEHRRQPVDLRLTTAEGHPAVRVTSPVGLIDGSNLESVMEVGPSVAPARFGVVRMGPRKGQSFSLTLEDVVLFSGRGAELDTLFSRAESVVIKADETERRLLGIDEPTTTFRDDLVAEVGRD